MKRTREETDNSSGGSSEDKEQEPETKESKVEVQEAEPEPEITETYLARGDHCFKKGTKEDYLQALELFKKGAEGGCAECKHKVGYLYDMGLGVEQDVSEAMVWYLKASIGKSLFNIGNLYEQGKGVEKDSEKAMEWYWKAANKGHEKSKQIIWKLSKEKKLYYLTKSRNKDFVFFESPFSDSFGKPNIQPLPNIEVAQQDVVVRFDERDFTLPSNYLRNSPYFSTMLNSNWNHLNETNEKGIILDMRPIQHNIFLSETPNIIEIFEEYFKYLHTNSIPSMDLSMKLKLAELTKFLGDDNTFWKILRTEELILMRCYILEKTLQAEPLHLAIASCLATSYHAIDYIPIEHLKLILKQSGISSMAKQEIQSESQLYGIANFNDKIVQVRFNLTRIYDERCIKSKNFLTIRRSSVKSVKVNNKHVTLTLREENDDYVIESSDSFGKNTQFFIHLKRKIYNHNWLQGIHLIEAFDVGFFIENVDGTKIFTLPDVWTDDINLVIMLND